MQQPSRRSGGGSVKSTNRPPSRPTGRSIDKLGSRAGGKALSQRKPLGPHPLVRCSSGSLIGPAMPSCGLAFGRLPLQNRPGWGWLPIVGGSDPVEGPGRAAAVALTAGPATAVEASSAGWPACVMAPPSCSVAMPAPARPFCRLAFLAHVEQLGLCWTRLVAPTTRRSAVLRHYLDLQRLWRATWHPSTLHRLLRLSCGARVGRSLRAPSRTAVALEHLGWC